MRMQGPGLQSPLSSMSNPSSMMSGTAADQYTEGAEDTTPDPTMSSRGRMTETSISDHGAGRNANVGQAVDTGGNVGRRVQTGGDASATVAKLLGR